MMKHRWRLRHLACSEEPEREIAGAERGTQIETDQTALVVRLLRAPWM